MVEFDGDDVTMRYPAVILYILFFKPWFFWYIHVWVDKYKLATEIHSTQMLAFFK